MKMLNMSIPITNFYEKDNQKFIEIEVSVVDGDERLSVESTGDCILHRRRMMRVRYINGRGDDV